MNKKSIYIALTATTCLAMLSCVTGQTCSAITQKNNRLGLEAKSPKTCDSDNKNIFKHCY